MGIIREHIELVGLSGAKTIRALFDSGADRNYVKRRLADGEDAADIGFHVYEGIHRAILANGSVAVGERVRFRELRIRGRRAYDPVFVIMDDLIEDAIIGVRLMQELGIALDVPNETITLAIDSG